MGIAYIYWLVQHTKNFCYEHRPQTDNISIPKHHCTKGYRVENYQIKCINMLSSTLNIL